mmetsp:Transcript_77885/g.167061  ORF Transcript_77885/g.167061 Transcript_77885/m.167061 type:complete len:353 (-) Transcript_77885:90-1148(-)
MARLTSLTLSRVVVKNTFLEMPDDDVFDARAAHGLKRQVSDSALLDKLGSDCQDEVFGDDCCTGPWWCRSPGKRGVYMKPRSETTTSFGSLPSTESPVDSSDDSIPFEYTEAAKQTASKAAAQPVSGDEQEEPEGKRTLSEIHSGLTTLMIRHVPKEFSQQSLMDMIDGKGFAGLYDFIYLPMDARSRANRGFAFINLISAQAAGSFYETFNDYQVSSTKESFIAVMTAHVQGIKALAKHFASSGTRRQQSRPLFLRCTQSQQQSAIEAPVQCASSALGSEFEQASKWLPSEQEVQALSPGSQCLLIPQLWTFVPVYQPSPPHSIYKFCPFCALPKQAHRNNCIGCGSSLLA